MKSCEPGDARACVGIGACAGGQFCEDDATWGHCEGGTTGDDAGRYAGNPSLDEDIDDDTALRSGDASGPNDDDGPIAPGDDDSAPSTDDDEADDAVDPDEPSPIPTAHEPPASCADAEQFADSLLADTARCEVQ